MSARLLCSTCGWTRVAPTAPTRLGTALGRDFVALGHMAAMALLDGGRVTHRVDVEPAPITITLELDIDSYVAALRKAAGQLEDIRWRNAAARERNAARRWWADYMTEAYARYGWDWPGPAQGGT